MKNRIFKNIHQIQWHVLLLLGLSGCTWSDLQPIGFPAVADTATFPSSDGDTESTEHFSTDSTPIDTHTATDSQPSTDTSTDTVTGSSDTPTDTHTDTETASADEPDTSTNEPKVWVGSATQLETFPDDFFQLWDQVTPENAGKWGEIEMVRDQMDWETLDHIYNTAREKGIPFKEHSLIWGKQQPSWIDNLPAAEQAEEVEEWISAFCQRYPDVEMINVTMAALHQPPSYTSALAGGNTQKYAWIIRTYEMARQYCPDAKLIVDEFNVLVWETDVAVALFNTLRDLQLIDGVGCAAQGLEGISKNGLFQNLLTVLDVGLPIYISGYSINEADDYKQLNIMKEQFPLFYLNPNLAGITFWGYVEGQTWQSNSFLRRANGEPRPALTWLMEYLNRPLP